MSTEVTADLMRSVAAAWEGGTASDDYARHELRARADYLEHQQRPLPTVPGWYPTVVVERGGESCTGALLTEDRNWWCTAEFVGGDFLHRNSNENTIRWAEQDGTTPGQTLWEEGARSQGWSTLTLWQKDRHEHAAAAVLAAHGTTTLTPVGEHTKSKRQPRVWNGGDADPIGVRRVQDADGDQWVSTGNGWVMSNDGRAWSCVAEKYGPLTEVLDED